MFEHNASTKREYIEGHYNTSLNLIIEIQREEVERLLKGKHRRVEEIPDVELAAQLFNEELDRYKAFQADRIMSRSIAQAVLTDADAIQCNLDEESEANYVRECAINFDSGENVPHTDADELRIDDSMLEKLAVMYIGDGQLPGYAESSSQGEKASKSRRDGETRFCVSCMTNVSYLKALSLFHRISFKKRQQLASLVTALPVPFAKANPMRATVLLISPQWISYGSRNSRNGANVTLAVVWWN